MQGATDPLWSSIGGFGVALVRRAGDPASRARSFHARAAALARDDMFELADEGEQTPGAFTVRGRKNQLGHLAVSTPGMVAGLAALLGDDGTMSVADLVEPAARILEEGPLVSHHVYRTWVTDLRPGYASPLERFLATPAARAIYAPEGRLPNVGERLRNPDYARTLRRLGRDGLADFYRGAIAEEIVRDFVRNGGLLRGDDLASYRVDETAPLVGRYRGLTVETPPLPSLGRIVLGALALLEPVALGQLDPEEPAYVDLVARATATAHAEIPELGDPATVAGHTTHVCAVDAIGNIVSMTHSLAAASGVVVPGLGFLFNGAMHRFDPRPGKANSIAPGRRRLTGMSPTIISDGNRPVAVIGSPGGFGILHGVLQVLLHIVDHRIDPQLAVDRPRFAIVGDELMLEAGYPPSTVRDLDARGWRTRVLPDAFDDEQVGKVLVLSRLADDGWRGGADPRGAGVALAVRVPGA